MADVVLVLHPAAFRKMTKGPGGLVDKHISKMTRVVEVACEVESPSPGRMPRNRTMINYATGGMARSIGSRTIADGVSEVEGKVWVGAEHAKYVLHGTAGPYQIPKILSPGRKPLHFFWHRMGKTVTVKKVMHPGIMANDFMSRGLSKGCALFGIR